MPTIDPEDYVSIMHAAQIMGISRQHVHAMLKTGKIKGIQIETHRFALRSDCEAYKRDPNSPGRPREKPADGRD